jgi:NO-binding membrane sensor protein with MHYT domain
MLDIHNVHRRPEVVRRNARLLLAGMLLLTVVVCVAAYVGSMRVERTLIYVLLLVFVGALLALLAGRIGLKAAPRLIQRYYVRHRSDLDPGRSRYT